VLHFLFEAFTLLKHLLSTFLSAWKVLQVFELKSRFSFGKWLNKCDPIWTLIVRVCNTIPTYTYLAIFLACYLTDVVKSGRATIWNQVLYQKGLRRTRTLPKLLALPGSEIKLLMTRPGRGYSPILIATQYRHGLKNTEGLVKHAVAITISYLGYWRIGFCWWQPRGAESVTELLVQVNKAASMLDSLVSSTRTS